MMGHAMALGKWAAEMQNPHELILNKHLTEQNFFLEQIISTYNFLARGGYTVDQFSAIKGAFYIVASNFSYDGSVQKLHKSLVDWAYVQISETEQNIFSKCGIILCSDEGKLVLEALEKHDSLEEFRSNVCCALKSIEQLSLIGSAQIWGVIKRHFKLFEIFLVSYVAFLENFDICSTNSNERSIKSVEVVLNDLKIPVRPWEPFKKSIVALNKQAMTRQSLCLATADISPYFSENLTSLAPVPGQELVAKQK